MPLVLFRTLLFNISACITMLQNTTKLKQRHNFEIEGERKKYYTLSPALFA